MRPRRLRPWLAVALARSTSGLAPRADPGGASLAVEEADEPIREPDPCLCKRWADVYDDLVDRCGMGHEFFFKTAKYRMSPQERNKLREEVGQQFCVEFFQRMRHNWCVNLNIGADMGQWCYVDKACKDLRGGRRVNNMSSVSLKICDRSTDNETMLSLMTPPQVFKIAQIEHVDLALLHKFAYPVSKKYLWEDVRQFWESKAGQLREALRREMQEIADMDRPYIFDTHPTMRPPHIVVQNMTVFEVYTSVERNDLDAGTWQGFQCLMRCEEWSLRHPGRRPFELEDA